MLTGRLMFSIKYGHFHSSSNTQTPQGAPSCSRCPGLFLRTPLTTMHAVPWQRGELAAQQGAPAHLSKYTTRRCNHFSWLGPKPHLLLHIRPGRVNGWTSPDEGCYKNDDNEPHCRMHTQEQWGQWALDSACHRKYEQPLPRSSRWLPCRNAGRELPVSQEKQWNRMIFKHWQLIQM